MTIHQKIRMAPDVGLHGRPGALIVNTAKINKSTRIILKKDNKQAEAISLIQLLALGVARGEEVEVEIEGEKEKEIMEEIASILEGKKR